MVNDIADIFYAKLSTLYSKVYRNQASPSATFPYVVYDVESQLDTYPTNDYYVYIKVFDEPNVSVRAINTIADNIDVINHSTINGENYIVHITRINRQFITNVELTTTQMVDLQYAVRAYRKDQ